MPITSLIKRNRQLLMYGIIGGFCSSLDFIVYSCLVMMGANLLIANVIGVNIGIITSFCLNRQYNFRVTDHISQRFLRFYAIGLAGLTISTGLLYVLVDRLGCNEFYAKIATIIIVALIQFILNKTITFKATNVG